MSISIKALGELAVFCNGEAVGLPQSKRTRALLAYLVLTARPHRRDRLCEVFWDVPSDPRGALRWSLSKLRPLVNSIDHQRLMADRERVTLLSQGIDVDIRSIALRVDKANLTPEQLGDLHRHLNEPFLDGVDLPEQALFQQWLAGERQEVVRLQGKVMARLSGHPGVRLPEQLQWSRQWAALEPYNPQAATQLLTQLDMLGLKEEAASLQAQLSKQFRNACISWSPSARERLTPNDHSKVERSFLAQQVIKFCNSSDGVRLAYATIGEGSPIVKAANWLSHLEHDWASPIWSPLFGQLAKDHHFVRYDERGNGLSDWNINNISFPAFVADLETVVDASGIDKFALLGISQGAAVSIEYAIRYPHRVTHLILFGAYAAGWRIGATEATIKEREAIMTLTRSGWGQDNPAYRQIFSSTFMPSANASELAWFNEFQRLTTSPENAVRFLSAFGDIDVADRLSQVTVPTLVIHSMGDLRIPVQTGRDIAATIPGAEFVGLKSDGHLLLGREPASETFVKAVRDFIAATPTSKHSKAACHSISL